MPDFWRNCGYELLTPGPDGRLAVTDDFLRADLSRPELAPVEESCAAERALNATLRAAPRTAVAPADLAALADPDARENYRFWLEFRDAAIGAPSIEAAYLSIVAVGGPALPPIIVDRLAQICLRHILAPAPALHLRAAELLFRRQKIGITVGVVMAADHAWVLARGAGGSGPLAAFAEKAGRADHAPGDEMTVLRGDNAALYRGRDEAHDLALDLTFGRDGLDALSRVLETWVGHFTGAVVHIQPVGEISDPNWSWHIGLDAEAMAMLNDLYRGTELSDDRRYRLLSLFRMEFDDPRRMRGDIAGRPVYLGLAMDNRAELRVKPQNLLLNLPLA